MSYLRIMLGAIAFILVPQLLLAQKSGRVIDASTSEPVEGAVVSVNGTYLKSITDNEGNFTLTEDADSVSVTHISFRPVTVSLKYSTEIKLEKKSYISEEVTISALRADNKSAIAYTDVSKAELEKQNNGRDFPFLLNSLPSVVVTSDAGAGVGYTGIRIRGSDATRVNVTINGVPVNDAESHQVYWVDLPDIASSVENVQVQRGLGNSTSGAGAFGATVNILTNKVSDKPYGTIASSVGSFNTFKNTVSFGSGLLNNAFAIEGRMSKITSDGYIDRATSDLKSFYLSAGYYGQKNSLRAIVFSGKEKTYQAWYGVPDFVVDTNRTYNPAGEYYDINGNPNYYNDQTDNYQQDNYQLIYTHEFNEKLLLNTTFHYTYGRGYYEEFIQGAKLFDYGLSDNDTTFADLIRRKWLSNDLAGANLSLDYHSSQLTLTGGISGNYYDGDHFDQVIASSAGLPLNNYPFEYSNDDAFKTDISAFLKTVYSINPKTDLTIDLQQRHVEYTYTGFVSLLETGGITTKVNFFNPKIGINYFIKKNLQAYVYGGIGHKEPVRDDYLAAISTDLLSPETLTDIELGLKGQSKKCSYGINFYYMDYKDQLVNTGKINDVGEAVRQNVPNSYRTGIEAEGMTRLNQFYLKGNITLSENKIKKYFEYLYGEDTAGVVLVRINEYSQTPISFSPAVTGFAGIGMEILKGLNAELDGKYVGKQYIDNTGSELRSLQPYFITDLHLSYTLTPKKIREITFQFSVFNLMNEKYSSSGATYPGLDNFGERADYNVVFPQAEINFSGGVVVKL
jgi:iron complex outermembrane receptor protein